MPDRKPLNGLDTYTMLGYLQKAHSIAAVDKLLHFYRVRKASTFHSLHAQDSIRIREGVVLFQRGLECTQACGIATQRNIYFLYSVLAGHMADLLNLLPKAEMSKKEKRMFLNEMFAGETPLKRDIFHMGWDDMRPCIVGALDSCCRDVNVDEWEDYLVRLWSALQGQGDGAYFQFLTFYSALCDPDNPYHVGAGECKVRQPYHEQERIFQRLDLKRQLSILDDTEQLVYWMGDTGRFGCIESKHTELADALEREDIAGAIQLVGQITEISPLDKMALYARSLICWKIGEKELACKIALCSAKLFNTDHEFKKLCEDWLMKAATDKMLLWNKDRGAFRK